MSSSLEQPYLSVIIPTFNRVGDLGPVLDQIQHQLGARPDVEIVVVDNNSTDATAYVVRSRAVEWRALRYVLAREQGASAARNAGYQASRGVVCVFLDDDVRLTDRFFECVESCLERHKTVRAFGGRVIPDWGSLKRPDWVGPEGVRTLTAGPLIDHSLGDDEGPYGEGNRYAFVSACCFVYRDLLDEMGGFRLDLGPNGHDRLLGDDSELCHRIRARGNTVLHVPSVTAYHPVAPGRLTKTYFRQWFFGAGRSVVRIEPDLVNPRMGGVPRYLFRQWAVARLKALVHAARGEAFRSARETMRAHHLSGMIAEYRHARPVAGTGTPDSDSGRLLSSQPETSVARRVGAGTR